MKGVGLLFICFVATVVWFSGISSMLYFSRGTILPKQRTTLDNDTRQIFLRDFNKEMVQREQRLQQVRTFIHLNFICLFFDLVYIILFISLFLFS